MPFVKDMLQSLRSALKVASTADILDWIEKWSQEHGREGTLTHETFAAYRGDGDTECHLGAAVLLLEFIDFHLLRIRDKSAAERVRRDCYSVIERSRKRRFDRSGAQEPSLDNAAINRLGGAYALIRYETFIDDLCQELMILCPSEGKERVRYSVHLGQNVIMRGHWHVLGSSICVSGVGYKEGHQPDMTTICFSTSDLKNDVVGGVLTGLTTEQREPVMMATVVIRLSEFDERLKELTNGSDARLLKEFSRLVPPKLGGAARRILDEIHNEVFPKRGGQRAMRWFEERRIGPSDHFVAAIRRRGEAMRLVVPGLLRFSSRRQ
jgi:hypothetical protein